MIGENHRPVAVYTSIAPHNGLIANFSDYKSVRELTRAPGRRGNTGEPLELRLDRTINGKNPPEQEIFTTQECSPNTLSMVGPARCWKMLSRTTQSFCRLSAVMNRSG